ncbi:hypothetical protein QR680_012942 [Steinernema hermaphroditum]|uniref:Uncharacterized protein n=1 Tax=Steinernema hermaphroditum TaxID=289476 RepID=A0AA39M1F4_9BILA|nr:hypothetical protein QR680_012942 [Steinernema hermaphroditum]
MSSLRVLLSRAAPEFLHALCSMCSSTLQIYFFLLFVVKYLSNICVLVNFCRTRHSDIVCSGVPVFCHSWTSAITAKEDFTADERNVKLLHITSGCRHDRAF